MAGRDFFSTGASGFNSGADDPIVNIISDSENGQLVLKVVRRSGKCGYVTSKGISAYADNASSVSGDVTVDTYADMQAYKFKSGVPAEITVVNDENKNRTNTFYKWTGSVLKWVPETDDAWQPTV